MFLQMVACSEAAHACKAPPIHSSLSGHRDPATPGRCLKCAMHARSAQDWSTKIFRWHPGAHLRYRNSLKSSPRRPTSHEQAPSCTGHDAALRSIHTLHRRKCSSSLQNCGLGYTYRPKYVERGLDLNQAMSRQWCEQGQTFIVHAGQSQRTRFSGCLPTCFGTVPRSSSSRELGGYVKEPQICYG